MQILVQGSGRRVKLTKAEVGRLTAAQQIVAELSRQTGDDGIQTIAQNLSLLSRRIDDAGEFKLPETTGAAK